MSETDQQGSGSVPVVLGTGAIAFGTWAVSSALRKRQFQQQLAEELGHRNLELVVSDYVRSRDGAIRWKLLLTNTSTGPLRLVVHAGQGNDPFSRDVLSTVLSKIDKWIQDTIMSA